VFELTEQLKQLTVFATNPFDDFASEFNNLMRNTEFSNSLLQLPEGKTFPVEFGKVQAGVLLKRRLYDILVQILFDCITTIPAFQGIIFIGPPGSGKVCCWVFTDVYYNAILLLFFL